MRGKYRRRAEKRASERALSYSEALREKQIEYQSRLNAAESVEREAFALIASMSPRLLGGLGEDDAAALDRSRATVGNIQLMQDRMHQAFSEMCSMLLAMTYSLAGTPYGKEPLMVGYSNSGKFNKMMVEHGWPKEARDKPILRVFGMPGRSHESDEFRKKMLDAFFEQDPLSHATWKADKPHATRRSEGQPD